MSINTVSNWLSCFTVYADSHHSKLGDTRPRVMEKTVLFGDTPQVSMYVCVCVCGGGGNPSMLFEGVVFVL